MSDAEFIEFDTTDAEFDSMWDEAAQQSSGRGPRREVAPGIFLVQEATPTFGSPDQTLPISASVRNPLVQQPANGTFAAASA